MEQTQTTISGALLALVIVGLPCLYALFRPEHVWRLRFFFSRWAYRSAEPPEPSAAGLTVVRVVAVVLLLLLGGGLVQAVERGQWTVDRAAPGDETTTTAFTETPGAPAGLQCATHDRIATVQSDFAARAGGSIDLGENPAATAEEAIAEYRQTRFPALSGEPTRRSENEFVFHDENDRVSLVIQVADAGEGWYVPLYHACQSFETEAIQRPEGN